MSQDKPCRTCTDFKTWAKIQKKTYDSEQESKKKQEQNPNEEAVRSRDNCPLDKDELGSKTWAFLHTMAAYYPDHPNKEQQSDMTNLFHLFSKFYPCTPCAEDLREQFKQLPPQTQSQQTLSQWLCKIHNQVNKKLGKAEFDCKLVNERWRDGWADGSCD